MIRCGAGLIVYLLTPRDLARDLWVESSTTSTWAIAIGCGYLLRVVLLLSGVWRGWLFDGCH
jgi:hypothetical protein